MNGTEHHRLPPRTLTAVATGEVEAADLELLTATRRSRLLLALAGLYGEPAPAPHPPDGQPPSAAPPPLPRAAWSLLCGIQRTHPAAVETVLNDPMVSAWALELLRRVSHGASAMGQDTPLWADTGLIGSLAAAAAALSRTRCSLRAPAHRGRLWLPSLGLTGRVARGTWATVSVECSAQGTVVFGDGGSVRLPDDLAEPSEGWEPLPYAELPDGAGKVALDHLAPNRDFRGLRDPVALSAKTASRWRQLVLEAALLLREEHTPSYRLLCGAVRSLVPVPPPSPARPVSATAPDAYGAITLSLPEDAPVTAATLVHESYHQLLAAVDDVAPLLAPRPTGPEPFHFAPWREDPRPLRGLLYGTHATAGLTAFWRRHRAAGGERADFEFAFHRWQLRVALAALHSARGLTSTGLHLVAELTGQASAWWPEQVAPGPARVAERHCADVTATWRATHLAVADPDGDALARRWLAGEPPPAVLPPALLSPAHPQSRLAARLWLARLRLTDPNAFDALHAGLESGAGDPWGGVEELSPADAALVAGDRAQARALFLKAGNPLGRPVNVSDWVGLGLAQDEPGPLLERPELVIALYAALLRAGTHPPGPLELARWIEPPARPADRPTGRAGRAGGVRG
ncbi:HEXXH motif-containing putative peptide modification protein [Streptomyces sp. NBC_00237]|uniref:aKG-HExxH-type peptide beta-hydroxylase n=1 Tax=Streptomyces sp. NBC_00237 TaxID=2975687 RepID=UPI0022565AA8|nr:HEXXH motif-containing putative peptide modification protein [Streptomyces sp. NBC_00237]MCX5204502.1 HEXXH motif-containing putative peptide modification protein [Streptomyces sp. NBC_00237]